jgi:hypothetical protein
MPTLYGLGLNMQGIRKKALVLLLGATLIVLLSCEEEGDHMTEPQNQPPETWLAEIAIDSLTHDFEYRIFFRWAGSDPEDRLSHYEYRISNSYERYSWIAIHRSDSTFVFLRGSQSPRGICTHDTLWVRAVDTGGLFDITPVYYAVPQDCPLVHKGID